ncbi:AAEL013840-PA [Aedes aegypti]|uniref:AAEL013840-PA n=1 Tax=Aedes aegypti TaxID=7159 RepID=Q16I04_AEDAE|nr:AAEL013840-PA [Aedes aegypti]
MLVDCGYYDDDDSSLRANSARGHGQRCHKVCVILPDSSRGWGRGRSCTPPDRIPVKIPLELALALGNISSSDDVFNQGLVEEDSIDHRIFSNGYGERSSGEVPKPAGCNTQATIVSLRPENNTDPRLIYSPSCTRVERCSGCCVSKRLSCQPTSTRLRTFSVNVLEYVSGTKTRFKNRDLAVIEEHVGCACQCRVKEEHCTALQKYNARNCRCECKNLDDRSKCLQQSDIKQWNPETCLCECLDPTDCTSGSYYDHNYCKCLQYDFYSIH